MVAVAGGEDGGRAVKSRIRTRGRRSRMTLPVRVSPSISLAPFFSVLSSRSFVLSSATVSVPYGPLSPRERKLAEQRESCVTATPCYANVIQAACAHVRTYVRTHARHRVCVALASTAQRGNGVNEQVHRSTARRRASRFPRPWIINAILFQFREGFLKNLEKLNEAFEFANWKSSIGGEQRRSPSAFSKGLSTCCSRHVERGGGTVAARCNGAPVETAAATMGILIRDNDVIKV